MTKYKADIGTECSNSHRNCQSFILVMAHAEQLIEQNHNEKKNALILNKILTHLLK